MPLGPPPEPDWTFRGDPMLQAPAAFSDGTVLLKTRPGDMLSLDVKDGSRPRWVYRGISQSSTPVVLVANAAVALGEGATVIGVNPADGSESFTMDFGSAIPTAGTSGIPCAPLAMTTARQVHLPRSVTTT